ncbi:hypothetical protein RchiOBHm_Chr2g0109841 [Rosa chinensis]|uniref:Uncharacterized protein n=1 Tax=Rosa chinensis TaxID=74649 RepID=A0A2P6RPP5_ROSCH|nr:hypothetical protein RchiOBHm_Chr2g0109841 [Rosa chinensis]
MTHQEKQNFFSRMIQHVHYFRETRTCIQIDHSGTGMIKPPASRKNIYLQPGHLSTAR